MKFSKTLIIIRGPCGVGKTTVARKFAKRNEFAFLEFDVFVWHFFPARTKDLSEYRLVSKNLLSVLKNFFEEKKSVILEGALMPWVDEDPFRIEKILKLAKKYNYKIIQIALVSDEKTCHDRMKKRNLIPHEKTIERIWESVNNDKTFHKIKSEKTIDSTVKSIEKYINSKK